MAGDGGEVVVGQRPGAGDGRSTTSAPPAGTGAGCGGPGGQDRADVGGAEPFERDRPGQRGDELVGAVRGTQGEEDVEFGAEAGVPDRGGADQERLAPGPSSQNRCSAPVLGRGARDGAGRGRS